MVVKTQSVAIDDCETGKCTLDTSKLDAIIRLLH